MDQRVRPAPHEIRGARADNPKTRERDLAAQLGISEAELVAAHCGDGVLRVEPRVNDLLTGLEAVGEVMALTRNESAVHEKIGVYDKVVTGNHNAMVLGENIDLRIFPKAWAHGFAVEKRDGGDIRRSLQFFDAAGEAVHKVHLRPASNLYAYQKLVAELESPNQESSVAISEEGSISEGGPESEAEASAASADVDDLRDRWSRLTDVHQFFGILKTLKLDRRQALRMVGQDYAWLLDHDAVSAMFHHAAEGEMPIMCFVGNRGCIQIHSGPIKSIKPMGPWINVLDETFHLHLRTDRIQEVWAVRKPTKDGHVTSLEAYGADGKMIIQFFGKRHEGESEGEEWRFLAENLPRIPSPTAA
ncbi:MAG: hemin-degrading factor [Mesorhizobium sp.]|uniref:hemin-degrading factor n=1 Tax=Mesorhizobium sp. TaxID=1871066 RepID=UPI000FE928D6|nr:hemin-degrading factor [Mesorhizobium sp.]RWO34966.1 MAG: hemin-degrading factor [Mesorhizobium sp.]